MRATRALIHLENLVHNLGIVAGLSGPGRSVCLAVKADAYGHGAVAVARTALEAGASHLAVATIEEARELRDAGITAPILLLSPIREEEAAEAVTTSTEPMVADEHWIRLFGEAAKRKGTILSVHLKVDTGMGRIGCPPEKAAALAVAVRNEPALRLAGTATHFPAADMEKTDYTEHQIDRFSRVVESIREAGVDPGLIHAGNSAAILRYPDALFDMVRPGIMAYGYYPSGDFPREYTLLPVMELETRVLFLKEVPAGTPISYGLSYRTSERTTIATLPVGYGDGYFRLLSNKAEVRIGDRRYPVAGRICMDQTMIDLGPQSSVAIDDPVVLFGPGGPDAEDLSESIGTIPYEITCSVSKRVPRIYLGPE